MSAEATNMAAELRAEEHRNATDRHITYVPLPDARTLTVGNFVITSKSS